MGGYFIYYSLSHKMGRQNNTHKSTPVGSPKTHLMVMVVVTEAGEVDDTFQRPILDGVR